MLITASIVLLASTAATPAPAPGRVHALKIQILSTMLADDGIGEWGFGAIVEVDGQRILFDTGARPTTVLENAKELKEVARRVPMERMLVETDSPYLAPVPHRGKPNQPAFVKHVAEEIAQLRGIPFEDVARATTDNFFRLFRHARRA